MIAEAATTRPADTLVSPHERMVGGGFVSIDGKRWAGIDGVDAMPPFLMSVVSDSDVWLFVGSNGTFSAGRRDADGAIFPCETVDKILRDGSAGVRTAFLVSRGEQVCLWEPWRGIPGTRSVQRNLYKRVDGSAVLFEEIHSALGLRFRWSLSACDGFGLVRHAVVDELAGEPASIRYLDGWHQLLPAGVDRELYARLSYLAIGYMRHERLPGSPLALYTLNTRVSDRPEPSESLRVASAWTIGHADPRILLSDAQVETFRRGGEVREQSEVRGEMGAYLAVDEISLQPHGAHDWYTVADTGLDHRAVLDLRETLRPPHEARRHL
jgi:hypothetical protein